MRGALNLPRFGARGSMCLQALGEPDPHFLPGPLVEVVGAEVDVDSPVGQQVIGNHQDRVSHRDDGPLAATPRGEAFVGTRR